MKRTLIIILAAVAALIVFGWLMHLVLVAANVNERATTTVSGMTPRRVWATIVMVLGLVAVVVGALALRQSAGTGVGKGRMGAIVAVVAGLIAAVNGALNLAVAKGGVGSGNGVIGGAAGFLLGLIAMALGGLALARSRRRVDAVNLGH